jgi:hypothetical protein
MGTVASAHAVCQLVPGIRASRKTHLPTAPSAPPPPPPATTSPHLTSWASLQHMPCPQASPAHPRPGESQPAQRGPGPGRHTGRRWLHGVETPPPPRTCGTGGACRRRLTAQEPASGSCTPRRCKGTRRGPGRERDRQGRGACGGEALPLPHHWQRCSHHHCCQDQRHCLRPHARGRLPHKPPLPLLHRHHRKARALASRTCLQRLAQGQVHRARCHSTFFVESLLHIRPSLG